MDRAAYFLFNESRIVKETMFDAMDAYDQGCVRNGGEDTRSVYLVRFHIFWLCNSIQRFLSSF